MNLSQNDLAIMDDVFGALVGTDAWDKELLQNPEILAAWKEMDKELNGIKGLVPDETIDRLYVAVNTCSSASHTAAILFGMRVANIIRDISARPSALSQFILDRTSQQKGGAAHG